jgi:hypothetical protein
VRRSSEPSAQILKLPLRCRFDRSDDVIIFPTVSACAQKT